MCALGRARQGGVDWEGCMGGASSVITMLYWTAGGKKKEKKRIKQMAMQKQVLIHVHYITIYDASMLVVN